MIDKLKDPKTKAAVLSVLAVLLFIGWQAVTGEAPPAAVIDAIEEHTDAEIVCDGSGNCSISIDGSGDVDEATDSGTPPAELLPQPEAAPEAGGVTLEGSAEGSGEK